VGSFDTNNASAEATQDVQDAKAIGFDAFALNTHDITDSWATDAIQDLLTAAADNDFKVFMSFDMSWGTITPADIPPFLEGIVNHPGYYTVNGNPFVSTYTAANSLYPNSQWESDFIQPLAQNGITPYFVPDFDQMSGYPQSFYSTYTVADGAFSWEAAWPSPGNSVANVSDNIDASAKLAAVSAGKVYMMRKCRIVPSHHPLFHFS
jgi:glucan endo-1,3-alpha-glucosidase